MEISKLDKLYDREFIINIIIFMIPIFVCVYVTSFIDYFSNLTSFMKLTSITLTVLATCFISYIGFRINSVIFEKIRARYEERQEVK